SVRLPQPAQRRPGPAPAHRRGVRAGLLAAADPGGEAGCGVRLRPPPGLLDPAAGAARRVLVPLQAQARVSPTRPRGTAPRAPDARCVVPAGVGAGSASVLAGTGLATITAASVPAPPACRSPGRAR